MKTKKDIVISAKMLRKAMTYIKQSEDSEESTSAYKGLFLTSKLSTITVITYYVHIPNLDDALYILRVSGYTYTDSVETPLWHPMITQEQKQKVHDIIHEAASLQIDKENSEKTGKDKKDAETITAFLNGIKVNNEKEIC